ncbi:cytochrome P450 [Ruegeria sp. SCP11]|uniref:cytochrome P450 n=1 Tax=Ruegeria sp. SCP11 TaxID=3141378 RepID=UPI003338EEDC
MPRSNDHDLSLYDLTAPQFLADPSPVLNRMRNEGPLVRTCLPLFGELFLTTGDEAARSLLKDSRFSRDPAAAGGKPIQRYFWWMPPFIRPLMESMLAKDGDEHKRLRSLVDHAFSRHSIEDMRPELAVMADRLLDPLPTDVPVEIVRAYAAPLPLMAICALLGLPKADRPRVSRWISPISRPRGVLTLSRALPGLYRTVRYFRKLFEEVRTDPERVPAGLIRELTRVGADGDMLSENELLSMVFTLFAAGHVTTVHLISDAIVGLLDLPEPPSSIVSGPARLSLAVEEFMRFYTPVLMTKPHFATEDLDFESVPIKRGDRVSALLIGANYDPARFDRPEEMRLDRRPNAHLGFGHGLHVCLGMQLARIEAQVALERLFTRFPALRLADTHKAVTFSKQMGVRGFERLDLRLKP